MHLDLQSQTDIAAGPRYRDLSDWVVLKILDEIRKGTLKSGQRIFEDDLAGQYGMSRAPVRDATHKLERLGVVERRPPRGVFVREWTDADRAEVLKILDALIELSAEEATGHLTDADFAQLEAILDEARHEDGQSVDSTEQARRDARFHLVIAERAGNRRLVELMEQLMLPLQLYTREWDEYTKPTFWLRIHQRLLDALRVGDPAVVADTARHNAHEAEAVLLGDTTAASDH